MQTSTDNSLGAIITLFYEEFMAMYGDEELASVATVSTINDLIWQMGENARLDTDQ